MFSAYPYYEYPLACFQLVLLMFGMGATLKPYDFLAVVRNPTAIVLGLVGLVTVGPLVGILVASLFSLRPEIAAGLMVVSVLPGGTLSNLFTYLGRGNVPLSIALTSTMTLGSLVTVPALLPPLVQRYVPPDVSGGVSMPAGEVLLQVLVFLFVPLIAGMACRRMVPKSAFVLSRWSLRLGMLVTAVVVVGSLGSGRIRPLDHGWMVPAAIAAFLLVAQQVSMVPFRLLGLSVRDRFAVGMELTARNVNLGLMLKATLFPATQASDALGNAVLYVLLFYGGASLVMSAPFVLIYRTMINQQQQGEAGQN